MAQGGDCSSGGLYAFTCHTAYAGTLAVSAMGRRLQESAWNRASTSKLATFNHWKARCVQQQPSLLDAALQYMTSTQFTSASHAPPKKKVAEVAGPCVRCCYGTQTIYANYTVVRFHCWAPTCVAVIACSGEGPSRCLRTGPLRASRLNAGIRRSRACVKFPPPKEFFPNSSPFGSTLLVFSHRQKLNPHCQDLLLQRTVPG